MNKCNFPVILAPRSEFYFSNLTKVKYSSRTIFLHLSSPLPVSEIREKDFAKDTIFFLSNISHLNADSTGVSLPTSHQMFESA